MKNKVLNSLIYSLVIGIICGCVGVLFNYAIKYTSQLRGSIPFYWQLVVMVALGPVIVSVNKWFNVIDFKGTDGVVQAARDGSEFKLKVSPAAALGLALTCLAESAGCKEGGSFQIGAPIAHWIGRKLNIEAPERRLLTMCAIAAGFASVLGVPFFAAVLAAEVAFNRLEFKYLPYTVVSSAVAYLISVAFNAPKLRYSIGFGVHTGFAGVLKLALVAILAGLLGRLMLHVFEWIGQLAGKISNIYIRVLAGGAVAAVICIILNSQLHLSAGNTVATGLAGSWNWYDFILKIFLLALLCKSGYKTGLLPQTITIGGTFGCLTAVLLGVDPAIGAAAGMIGIVGGVSCCPAASFFLAMDMFGFTWQGILYAAAFAALGTIFGTLFNGAHGYYSTKPAPMLENK